MSGLQFALMSSSTQTMEKTNAERGLEGRIAMSWQYNMSEEDWAEARLRVEELAARERAGGDDSTTHRAVAHDSEAIAGESA